MFYYLLCSEIKSSTIQSAIMNLIFLVNILLSVFSIHATASSFSPVDKKEENATHTNMNPSFLDMIEGRIVNGETVDAGTYPWFTRLSNGNSLVCGGFLVSKRYVLTAAHCSNYFNKAQVGALRYPYRYGSNGGQFVEEFSIEESIIHPNFNTNTLNNDFLLVKLRGTSSIDPVKIDDGSYSPHYTDETNLWSIGMGRLRDGGSLPSVLQHVDVSFIPRNECNINFEDINYITTNMMCAADQNKDACAGDSGGPLYDEVHDAVVGVTSWGIGCADERYPGVYARISAQYDWIKRTICEDDTSGSFCDSPSTSPSSVPSNHPSSVPSNHPSSVPSNHPSSIPSLGTGGNSGGNTKVRKCFDFPYDFSVSNEAERKNCKWASSTDTATRCDTVATHPRNNKVVQVKNICPVACNTGCNCIDKPGRFHRLSQGVGERKRWCQEMGNKRTKTRMRNCRNNDAIYAACPETCMRDC